MNGTYKVLRVRSHERDNVPDGREVIFSGTLKEVKSFMRKLPHNDASGDLIWVQDPTGYDMNHEEWLMEMHPAK